MQSQDIDPVDDSDLLLIRPDISTAKNAYPVLSSATNLLYLPEDYGLEGYLWGDDWSDKTASLTQISSLLTSNKQFFAIIQDGCKRDFCFKEESSEFSILAKEFEQMDLLLLAKTKFLIEAGNMDEALQTAELSLRIGYLYEKDAEYIVEALAGITIIARSLSYIEQIIDQGDFKSDKITNIITQLSEIENLRKGLENGYKSEYLVARNKIDELLASNVIQRDGVFKFFRMIMGKDYCFKPNKTKKTLAQYWRKEIKLLNNPDTSHIGQNTQYQKLPKGSLQRVLYFFKDNSIGKIFILVTTQLDFSNSLEGTYATEKKVSELKAKLVLKQKNTVQ